MDRYKDENEPQSRTDLNQELYQNVSNNAIYANITDVTNANAFEISNNNQTRTTREAYQQMQKYQNMEPVPRSRKELEDFNYLYQKRENKIYDINSVLEEARRNRQEKDDKEEKRKLKNNEYNILSGVNKEELEKYREEKKKRLTTPEEDEIRELIDTIASKTLAGEIDKATSVNLLSDLMATNVLDRVDGNKKEEEKETTDEIDEKLSLSKKLFESSELEEKQEEQEEKTKTEKDLDFYTRSMDLSEKDFNLSDEFKEKSLPLPVKILIFLLIVALIIIVLYFIKLRIS
jgi:hypothetical protein